MSQTITKLHADRVQPRSDAPLTRLRRHIAALWQQAATRRYLAQLDERALSDIGVSRAQAQFEAERPLWQLVPGNHR